MTRDYGVHRRQLFSWWKRWLLFAAHCSNEHGHSFLNAHDEHPEEPKVRWVLGWCVDCGECREIDIR